MLVLQYVFDYRPGDIYACVADIGWITGHSYVVYGPLCNGATTVLFESIPTYPDPGVPYYTCTCATISVVAHAHLHTHVYVIKGIINDILVWKLFMKILELDKVLMHQSYIHNTTLHFWSLNTCICRSVLGDGGASESEAVLWCPHCH